MADPFVAEIRIFPFNFAPSGWAFCNGQLLPISQNTALFSLLGTIYGGDGKSNFSLPNMGGKAPMHPGQGAGLSQHDLGETGGSESVSLIEAEIPTHTHLFRGVDWVANRRLAQGSTFGTGNTIFVTGASANGTMANEALAPAGGDLPHNNMQPYLTLNFCIALQGVFPSRW